MGEEGEVSVTLGVLHPVAMGQAAGQLPAPRIGDLNSKTIGLLWNGKAGGDVFLQLLADRIGRRFPQARLRHVRGAFPTSKEVVADAAASCDAVIGAQGD